MTAGRGDRRLIGWGFPRKVSGPFARTDMQLSLHVKCSSLSDFIPNWNVSADGSELSNITLTKVRSVGTDRHNAKLTGAILQLHCECTHKRIADDRFEPEIPKHRRASARHARQLQPAAHQSLQKQKNARETPCNNARTRLNTREGLSSISSMRMHRIEQLTYARVPS